jgi:hypothetical protein
MVIGPTLVSHSIIKFLDLALHSLLKSTKSDHNFQWLTVTVVCTQVSRHFTESVSKTLFSFCIFKCWMNDKPWKQKIANLST